MAIILDDQALGRLVRVVAGAPQGQRNNLAFWAACRAGEMARSGLIGLEAATAVIAAAATRAGLGQREAERTAAVVSMPTPEWRMSDCPALADAEQLVETALAQKRQLMVHAGDLPARARVLRDLLAQCEYVSDRDVPVKLVQPSDGGPMRAVPLTANNFVIEAHHLCQPVKLNRQGELVAVTFPERVARMYLDMGEWNLRPLTGITTAPDSRQMAASAMLRCVSSDLIRQS